MLCDYIQYRNSLDIQKQKQNKNRAEKILMENCQIKPRMQCSTSYWADG